MPQLTLPIGNHQKRSVYGILDFKGPFNHKLKPVKSLMTKFETAILGSVLAGVCASFVLLPWSESVDHSEVEHGSHAVHTSRLGYAPFWEPPRATKNANAVVQPDWIVVAFEQAALLAVAAASLFIKKLNEPRNRTNEK